ncbi:MAG: inositol phosphorylceramide synthase [Chloroflexi bacterium]|nr:inositol phosphorylceramide synthase [Chloroflexota bacterium]
MNQKKVRATIVKSVWLVVIVLLGSGYFLLNEPRESIHILRTAADSWIPLAPGFVFPYVSLYLLLVFTILRFLKAETRLFSMAALAVCIDIVLSYIFYVFFQTGIERPTVSGSDISSDILRWIYSIDEPYNAFPSLHTSSAVLCTMLWRRVGSRFWLVIMIWAGFIVASTVLTKQHYFVDILGGIAVAIVSYFAASKAVRTVSRTAGEVS